MPIAAHLNDPEHWRQRSHFIRSGKAAIARNCKLYSGVAGPLLGASVSGGKNPVPNSKRAGLSRPFSKSRRHLSRRQTSHNEFSVRFRLCVERGP